MSQFAGRTALITGGASGIGLATAQRLAADGVAELVLVDRDQAGLDAVDLPCQVRRFCGDVADEALWDRIEAEVDRLDHALLNAGIANGCPIASQGFAEWRQILSVNLDGMFLALRSSLRIMQKGTGRRSVVMTSSVAGTKPMPMSAAYGSSKAGVAHLARIAAAEMAGKGVRVNAIAPGRVDTPIWTQTDQFKAMAKKLGSDEAAKAALASEVTASDRLASAGEVAGQIVFLLSDAAENITGHVLVSDGGYSL